MAQRGSFVHLEAVDQAFAREQARDDGQIGFAVLNGVAAGPPWWLCARCCWAQGLPSTLRYGSASHFTRTVDCGDTKHCYFIGLEIGVFNLISTRIAAVSSVLYILTRKLLARDLQPNSLVVT